MSSARKKLTGADYLLLLLYLNDHSPIFGAVRLTKMMFLFNKEISEALKKKNIDCGKLPDFIPYNFGPFSKDVYEQIELFSNIGFIKVTDIKTVEDMGELDDWEESPFIDETVEQENGYIRQERKYFKYEIESLGIHFVEEKLLPELMPEQKEILERFKSKITSLSPKQILKYVYTKYPDFTENSLIKDEVLGHE